MKEYPNNGMKYPRILLVLLKRPTIDLRNNDKQTLYWAETDMVNGNIRIILTFQDQMEETQIIITEMAEGFLDQIIMINKTIIHGIRTMVSS